MDIFTLGPGNTVLEGTLESLLSAQPVDTRGERKRSGRPCVGGKGEVWDQLLQVFLHESHTRTKNGLPGVPYTIKNTLSALKSVWSDYVPDVTAGTAPTDFLWISTCADHLIHAITSDVYATADSGKLLHALADAAAVLAKRTSVDHVTDVQAPQVLYPPELQAKYRAAAMAGSPMQLHPSPCTLYHYVRFSDMHRIMQTVQEMRKDSTLSPEAARLLGWGQFVLTLLLPMQGGAAPLDVQMGLEEGSCIDSLRVWKDKQAAQMDKELPLIDLNRQTKEGYVLLGGASYGLSPEAVDAFEWVYSQREGAMHMERLLPRRLSADVILRRLSKGPLKPLLKGKLLTVKAMRTAWTTHAFHDVLQALDARLEAMNLHCVDPLTTLSRAVLPRTLASLPTLYFPGDDVPASALVVGGLPQSST